MTPYNNPKYQALVKEREQLKKMWDDNIVEKDGQKMSSMNSDQLKEFNDRSEGLAKLNDEWEAEYKTLAFVNANEKALEIDRQLKGMRTPGDEYRHPEIADTPEGRNAPVKSMARQIVESEAYKSALRSHQFKGLDIEMKGVELKTLMTTAAGFAPFVPRIDRVELYPDRRPLVGSLMPNIPTNDSAIKYMEETTRTNNAAPASEGNILGEAAFAYTERTSTIEDIGNWLPITMQQLEDVAGFETFIGGRLEYLVALAEENQFINGNGSTPQLNGFLAASGVQSQATGALAVPDAIAKAMALVRGVTAGAGFAEPTAVVMHPTDMTNLQTLKTAQGIYIWGNPADATPLRVWGKPVVVTPVIAQGTCLTGDFQMYAAIYRKQEMRVQITDSHDVFFIYNKLAMKAYTRTAQTIFRPSAFAKVTGMPA
jgi:HK97 family phage major capsid protein